MKRLFVISEDIAVAQLSPKQPMTVRDETWETPWERHVSYSTTTRTGREKPSRSGSRT